MCGIAGFIDAQCDSQAAEALIDRMCKVIRHRGPDDQGVWLGDGAALGMRRLAIIDLEGGQQPIFNEDRSVLVVFNGEIYNYRDLRTSLRARGHRFRTSCDTEVIVHAYEEYGDDCVMHLRGMFSFALWDRKRRRLLAARDRFGKKPLNYYWDGRRLLFGSEIKAILEADVPRVIHPQALDEYLAYCYVPTPKTLFKDIWKVPAGHILIYEDGQVNLKRYWELSFEPTCQDDEVSAIEHIRELLRKAVRSRLVSDVPLGAFLSGGIDSSVVVGLMSAELAQPVKTFSIGFEEADFSELPYARQVAKHFGTEHHEFYVRPDLVSILPQLAWDYDEPFADASMLPTYYVSRLAREHVTVVLTGDGGDEIFGGYRHYAHELLHQHIPSVARSILSYASAVLPRGVRGKRRLRSLRFDLATRHAQEDGPFLPGSRRTLYSRDYFAQVYNHDPYAWQVEQFAAVGHLDPVTRMQYIDVRTYLSDDILVKVDKASMFASLETRAPLLDQDLVEYVASLPSALRLRDGVLKYLLKQVAVDMLPPSILARRKQGFSVPINHWFRGELAGYAHDLLTSSKARQRNIFDPRFIDRVLKAHTQGELVNHSAAIWTLLCLELWFQVYLDQPPIAVGKYVKGLTVPLANTHL